jgi:hypothetical protein
MRVDEMKKSNEWFTQEKVSQGLDDLIAKGWVIGDFTPYAAATELGAHANSDFYRKFDVWLQARAAQSKQPFMRVTPTIEAEFRSTAANIGDMIFDILVSQHGDAAGIAQQAAEQRVVKAEHEASIAKADRAWMLEQWSEAEAGRDASVARCTTLEQELADAQLGITKLTARLDERADMLRELETRIAAEIGEARPLAEHAAAPEVASGTGKAEPEAAPTGTLKFDNRPSDSEPDHPQAGQSELPLDSTNSNPNGEEQ